MSPPATASAAVAFSLPVRVYWEDTDAGGVVYYANYLKFLERARTEWLRALGVHQEALREQGQLFVVSHVDAHYLKPARLDDALEVHVGLGEARAASVVFVQSIWRGAEVLLRAQVKAVCVDALGFKPRRVDPQLLKRLSA